MTLRQRELIAYLLQGVLYLGIILFALYEFKRHTTPQPIFFTTAEIALKAGNESAARKEFDEALRQRPHDPTAYASVIDACITQNKPALEAEYAQRAVDALTSQPPEVRAAMYQTLASAYSQIDHSPHLLRAISAAKRALDLVPESRVMQNEYGYLLADNSLGRGPDVDTALAILKKALDGIKSGKPIAGEEQLGPMFVAETEDSYGWALYKDEQYADALTALNQALEDYPDNAPGDDRKVLYYHLGMVYNKLSRRDQASNAFNSALAYDAKYADALAALARANPPVPVPVSTAPTGAPATNKTSSVLNQGLSASTPLDKKK